MIRQQAHRVELSGIRLEIIKAVRRMPKGLSWNPACQMLTRSAFHVSTGPTLHAWIGTPATSPPRSCGVLDHRHRVQIRLRVLSLRYSSGVGGLSRVLALGACGRIVEGPVLDLSLPALHDDATHLS